MLSEKQIQEHIWKQRDTWTELIDIAEISEPYLFADDLSDITPNSVIQNHIYNRLSRIDKNVRTIELIGCEVPLDKELDSTLRADFLGASIDEPIFAIIELKKNVQTERQAFSELLAYSNHITTAFPTTCKEDIYSVLIAPMEARITRESVIHTLVFDRRPIYALIPYFTDEDNIETLRLKPWIPSSEDLSKITGVAFDHKNFSLVKIAWEYIPEFWNEPNKDPSDWVIANFNRVSVLTAQIMEAQGLHGFVYCSQVWPELYKAFPFPNSMIIAALNPYIIGNTYWYIKENNYLENNISQMLNRKNFQITNILPGLNKSAKNIHKEYNYLSNLYDLWNSHLFRIGLNVVKRVNQDYKGSKISINHACMTWESYQKSLMEDSYCKNFDIITTGLVREIYCDVTSIDYEATAKTPGFKHPIYDGIPNYAINILNNREYFSRFLSRMFNPEFWIQKND
ncbi:MULTISPECIES: hypothetical protein [Calothrix]|uniref:Uncharacterized protein n=2 Tax=Calothrix TaxID=1186 RepID=A0ABR8ABP0_9CYAN|nr:MULTISPECIES: hypothetical protein [Calothrix]MBD2197134.1 hypothetical protein [Calothrix parietina FACHB-288]MBD2201445.1 hypothetical protein [Calothrix sp. FACHB-168]MBD2215877.1 hypothetical protein [Calothrix sp. FACHB-1219]MBD2225780.1 hypothetical protein [Calothrix anomala FACHB-343]